MTTKKARKSTPCCRACSKRARHERYHKPNIHPGRTSMYWKCTAFLSGSNVDDGELFVHEDDVYDFKIDFTMDTSDTRHHHTDMKVSLLDIARPAKQKGAVKDFEVVQKVRNVVALEDDFESLIGYQWEDDEWDDWEQISDATEKKSYSSVLKGD